MTHVALFNINRIQVPAVAPIALRFLGSALIAAGHTVDIVDLTPVTNPIDTIREYLSGNCPDLIGITLRNLYDMYFPSYLDLQERGSFLSSHQKLVAAIVDNASGNNRVVMGGVGFSSAPHTLLKEFGLRFGVQGPGERTVVEIADRMSRGETLDHIFPTSGIIDARKNPITNFVVPGLLNDSWYYRNGGLGNVRITNGCGMRCVYCVEPFAKGGQFTRSGIAAVIAQIRYLVECGVQDIQFTDSESNMPLDHIKAVFREIAHAQFPNDLRLWLYCQPKPFDEELGEVFAAANVRGINFGTDHTDPVLLRTAGKWYGSKDIVRATRICQANGIAVMHELLHGLPGDTPEKMKRAIDFLDALDPYVIGVTIGYAVMPETPLATTFQQAQQKGETVGWYLPNEEPMINPTYYVDPAFRIPEAFEDLREYVGERRNRIMISSVKSTAAINNQLIDSERVREQIQRGTLRGPAWWNYPQYFRGE